MQGRVLDLLVQSMLAGEATSVRSAEAVILFQAAVGSSAVALSEQVQCIVTAQTQAVPSIGCQTLDHLFSSMPMLVAKNTTKIPWNCTGVQGQHLGAAGGGTAAATSQC